MFGAIPPNGQANLLLIPSVARIGCGQRAAARSGRCSRTLPAAISIEVLCPVPPVARRDREREVSDRTGSMNHHSTRTGVQGSIVDSPRVGRIRRSSTVIVRATVLHIAWSAGNTVATIGVAGRITRGNTLDDIDRGFYRRTILATIVVDRGSVSAGYAARCFGAYSGIGPYFVVWSGSRQRVTFWRGGFLIDDTASPGNECDCHKYLHFAECHCVIVNAGGNISKDLLHGSSTSELLQPLRSHLVRRTTKNSYA